ncbi:MAG: hypothetical protein HY420_02750 [Candidatus Kerfeldbacteria bacterium]|nr:hypothetical protein [Candidatus Kerfeldbacteria bacterium]
MSLVGRTPAMLAGQPQTANRTERPEVIIFLGPDGSGRNTLISCLEVLGFGQRCQQHTTRPPRHPDDQDHYVHIGMDDFSARRTAGEYLLPHLVGHHWFGEPISDVQQAWSSGKVALLKGPVRRVEKTKSRILKLNQDARILTVCLLTDPRNLWITALNGWGVPDLAERIMEGKRELDECLVQLRSVVDGFVTNYAGDPRRMVDDLMKLRHDMICQ